MKCDECSGSDAGDAIDLPRAHRASGPDEVDHEVTREGLKDSCFIVTEDPSRIGRQRV